MFLGKIEIRGHEGSIRDFLEFNIFDKIFNIPVEYNASKRALWYLKEYHYLSPSEMGKAKKLLGIAAQTYIASLFDGIIIFGDRLNSIFNKKK